MRAVGPWLAITAMVLAFGVASAGCEKGTSEHDKRFEQAAQEEEEAAAAAQREKEAAEELICQAAEEETRRLAAERADALADRPEGNNKTTDELARDDADREIIALLEEAETFEKVARRVAKNQERWEPLMRVLLRHQRANVRTQVGRVFIMNEWKNEEITKAWIEAILAEKDDILRENWGVDLRAYAEPATLPALHKAFRRCVASACRRVLARTLTRLQHEPVLADIYKMLATSEDTMTKADLLDALELMPREANRDHILPLMTDSNELVRLRAKEAIEAIDLAAQEAAEGAPK